MTTEQLHLLKFPVGEFETPVTYSTEQLEQWMNTIAHFPERIIQLTQNLSVAELNWKYRPEGWSIKQVVHHCADSHMNSLIRYKLSLTEEQPVIKPYMENLWANLVDGNNDDLSATYLLLEGLHKKWTQLLRSMTTEDFEKFYVHPEHHKSFSLKEATSMYDWHCRHHLAHVEQALQAKGKY